MERGRRTKFQQMWPSNWKNWERHACEMPLQKTQPNKKPAITRLGRCMNTRQCERSKKTEKTHKSGWRRNSSAKRFPVSRGKSTAPSGSLDIRRNSEKAPLIQHERSSRSLKGRNSPAERARDQLDDERMEWGRQERVARPRQSGCSKTEHWERRPSRYRRVFTDQFIWR